MLPPGTGLRTVLVAALLYSVHPGHRLCVCLCDSSAVTVVDRSTNV